MQTLADLPDLSDFQLRLALLGDRCNRWLIANQFIVATTLIVVSVALFVLSERSSAQPRTVPFKRPAPPPAVRRRLEAEAAAAAAEQKKKNEHEMAETEAAAAAPVLDAPKDTPFSTEELKSYNGSDESKPIYVAIKGQIFDVSAKRDMYGPGAGYNVFAGKDGSRGLGKSSLKPEDAVADYSTLDQSEVTVLDDWVKYFTKRYNIVGKIVD
ncbi:hypothetical protein RQP46_011366 [Phenoliferia psychrophenolica]